MALQATSRALRARGFDAGCLVSGSEGRRSAGLSVQPKEDV
jgi:hypothetical protein